MKILDGIIFLLFLSLCISGFIYSIHGKEGSYIQVQTSHGNYRYSLKEDKTITFQEQSGQFSIEILGKKVRVIESYCPQQLCKSRSWINKIGDSLICVPNKRWIKILGPEQVLDGITQ